MSGPSSEEGFPSPKSFVKRNQWKKDRQIAENADILGVCLLGKHVPRASYRALCSGSVVRGLPEYSQKKIFVITSENIVPKEKEGDLQSEWKAFNTKDYYLYFKRLDSSNKLKTYKLHEITNSKEQVKFTSGLVIIPIDAKKLNRKSGLKTYRPFKTDKNVTDPSSLHGSVCQIVDGNTNSFDVKPYNLKYINDEYVLELPEKGYTYKNRSELTASGANSNLHAYGAIILQSSLAVGVLNFDHKISPVLFSQLPGFGSVAKGTAATSPVVPEEDCRGFGQMAVGQDVPELVAPRRQPPFLEAPGPSVPGHGAAPQNQVPRSPEAAEAAASEPSVALQHQAPSPEPAAAAAPGPSAAPQNQVPRSSEAAETAAPGPSAALQHQAPSPEAAAAAAPGSSAALLNQAPPPKPTREVMPEHNAASLLNQTSPPELSGATVPSPLNQALSPREEAAAAVPVGRGVAEQNWNTDSKFVNNITGTKNVLIGDNITATIGSSSTDAASQHQAPPPNTAAATVPGPSVPQAGPKFFNNIQRADNVMIGDHIKATIGVSSTDAAATQHQAPPQPPGGTAPRAAAPEAAAPRTRSVPQAVPKFLNNIQCTGNIMVGDYIKATIGTSSIDAAATQHQAPPQPPGGTAPRAAAPRTRSAQSGNCAPTPAKFSNNIQGAGTIVTGDHATVNIVSSSRRGTPASNTRT